MVCFLLKNVNRKPVGLLTEQLPIFGRLTRCYRQFYDKRRCPFMPFRNFFFLVLSILTSPAFAAIESRSLEDCYAASLARSETIGTQEQILLQSKETQNQSLGAVLPTITGTASYLRQGLPSGGSVASGIFPDEQPLIKLTFTQPLFQGFAEYAALRQTKILTAAQKEAQKFAMMQLYTSIAQVFFTVLSMEKDLKNIKEEIKFYEERVTELKERVRIGQNQLSDVLTVQVSMAGLQAQIQQDQATLWSARENLAYLTGFPSETLLNPTEAYPHFPLPALEDFLASQSDRPDVKGAELQTGAAIEQIGVARASHLPTANLMANYYLVRAPGFSQTIKWDVTAALTLPIFSGGIAQSKIRAATAAHRVSDLSYSQIHRQADLQIRNYYRMITADHAQVIALKDATALAEKNYNEQKRVNRLGLNTNIDVLTALATFQEDNRLLDKQKFAVHLDYVNLQISSLKRKIFNEESGI